MIGGAVWSYFQTISIKQSTYAPLVIIGSGLSIMHVMALVFIIELIGDSKVSVKNKFAIYFKTIKLVKGGRYNQQHPIG